ncbi:MAG: rod shape-determining protein MreD [Ascidiaceihabitans sp.]|jgi:rod shape-determining protein MreD
MNDHSTYRIWLMRSAFVGLALVILFVHLLPLNLVPSNWALPNLMIGFAFAWSVRRPEYVPPVLLGLVLLLADLLLQRPPGLWAAIGLLACESLKAQAPTLRVATFLTEWATVTGLIIGATVVNRVILAVLLVDVPGLWLTFVQMGMTILFYPAFVFVTHVIMGVRKSVPGDLDTLGGRT